MQRLEYHHMDKSKWERGPWDNEPDKIQWQDEATGLPCLMVRNHFGAWCGYVGVSEGHPFYGKYYGGEKIIDGDGEWDRDYANSPSAAVSIGLTFSDFCHPNVPEDRGICHKVEPGENDKVWWLGFDCNGAFDLAPGFVYEMQHLSKEGHKLISDPEYVTYRDVACVQDMVATLARELKEIQNETTTNRFRNQESI